MRPAAHKLAHRPHRGYRARVVARVRLLIASALLASAAAALTARPAMARVEVASPYTKAQTYSGALRYLRVDLGFEIVERDPDAAYLLFQFVPSGKSDPTRGSVEVIEVKDQIRVILQLPELPEYREAMLRDGLLAKLAGEYGAPPERTRPAERGGDQPEEGEEPAEPGDEDDGSARDGEANPSQSREDRDGDAPAGSAEPRRDPRRREKRPRR